jgi:hypothetical protein
VPDLTPVNITDEQLEKISIVTLLDIESAKSLWRASVPLKWKTLLDSQTIGIDDPLTSRYVWSGAERRYIDRNTGKFVPFELIRSQAIDPLIAKSKQLQRQLAQSLQAGGSLGDFQMGMINQIKATQVAAALAANGGENNTDQNTWKKISGAILALLLFFKKFWTDITTKKQPLNGSILTRADLYAAGARGMFEQARQTGYAVNFGEVQERRVLGIAEHCRTHGGLTGCVELADLGWQPIGTLPKIGESPCRTNCKCHFDYRYKNESGDWVYIDDSATTAKFLLQIGITK